MSKRSKINIKRSSESEYQNEYENSDEQQMDIENSDNEDQINQNEQLKTLAIERYGGKDFTEKQQKTLMLRKINICLLYYLSTEVNDYQVTLQSIKQIKHRQFIFIKSIVKGK